MKKVCILLVDTGVYNSYINLIKLYERNGDFEVIGIIATCPFSVLDGYKVLNTAEEITQAEYCLLAMEYKYEAAVGIIGYMETLGLRRENVIPINVLKIPGFVFEEYIKLRESRPTIVCNTCYGGILYNYLGIECISPTKNLFFDTAEDYLEFVDNFEMYMSQELQYYGDEGKDENSGTIYPIAYLGDSVCIHFNHYKSFTDAQQKWNQRRAKINYNNLIFVFASLDKTIVDRFNSLKRQKKICFTSVECADDKCVAIYYEKERTPFYRAVNQSASHESCLIDVIKLLNFDGNVYRNK